MKIDNAYKLKALKKGKDLEDRDEEPILTGQAIAEIMLSAKAPVNKFSKMKTFDLSQKFYNDKTTEIDASDLETLKAIIEADDRYNALVGGQLLKILADLKEDKEEEKEDKEDKK